MAAVSIRETIMGKWYELFFYGFSHKSCFLCETYEDDCVGCEDDCAGCPIFLYTGLRNCHNTPYWDYRKHILDIHGLEAEYILHSHIALPQNFPFDCFSPSMIRLNIDNRRPCCHEYIREELLFLFKVLKIERKRCKILLGEEIECK